MRLKFESPSNISLPELERVQGTTLTVPNMAPSLIELLNSSISNGEPLPDNGLNVYDDSDEAGLTRLLSRQRTVAEVVAFGETQATNGERSEPNEAPTEPEATTSEPALSE